MPDLFNSPDTLYPVLLKAYRESAKSHFVILIAGCSRSGKSTLTAALAAAFDKDAVPVLTLSMDAWLVSVEKRKPGSSVAERYELDKIYDAVCEIKAGRTVHPPVYDPISRRRLDGVKGEPLALQAGVIIIEGVVALADPALISLVSERIFVNIPDITRIKRLIDFYKRVKRLPQQSYKEVILSREKEEVPFVKNTASQARIHFSWA